MNDSIYQCVQCKSPLRTGDSLCSTCGALVQIDGNIVKHTGQTCFACGHQQDGKSASCPECGETYTIECPNCGHEYVLGIQKCPECGFDHGEQFLAEVQARENRPMQLFGSKPSGVVARLGILLGLVALVFYFFEKVQLEGAAALGALVIVLGLLSLVVVYVIYSPGMGSPAKRRRKPQKPKGRFALVYRTLDLARAEHLKVVLESEGIPAFIYHQHATTLDPFDPFSGIRVMVPTDRLSDVSEIMKAFGFDTDDFEDPAG